MMNGGPEPQANFRTVTEALANAARSSLGLHFCDARDHDTFVSYRELYERARKMAGALEALGVRPGDRVALVLPTSVGFMDAFFGTLCAGAIPVPLYPPVRLGRLDEYHRKTAGMIEVVKARVVITDGRVRRLLGQAIDRARPELGCHNVDALLAQSNSERQVDSARPEDLALIQFSSGTTVDSKPAALSHRNLLANVAVLERYFLTEPEPHGGVAWLPLYHDMGLIGCLLLAVYHPGPLCLIPPELFLARPSIWLKAISRHKGTVSPAPNFAYGLCLKRVRDEEMEGVDLSSWKFALNGAEPVSPQVLARFAERFGRWGFRAEALTPVYGLSEASLAVTFSKPLTRFTTRKVDADHLASAGEVRDGDREVVSVGSPLAGISVEVRNEDGVEVSDGKVGRVWVRGPSVMTGYFGNPEATSKALRDGWLDTGDLGFVSHGELFLCGRAKELVILRGANHAPQEFEECLDGIVGVRTGCTVALGYVPSGADGEELALLVETEREQASADAKLIEQIRGQVAERTGIRPHEVVLLDPGTLPRTSSGKLRRAEAARRWLSGELTAPKPVTALRIAAELVKSEIGFIKARRAK
jgi:acyl-CoA synthetase (AMP-forming)/AMP-acid ligase II